MLATIAISVAACTMNLSDPGADAGPGRFEYSRIVMGVRARVVVFAGSEAEAGAAANRAFERMNELDAALSDYRVDSPVSVLNATRVLPGELPRDLAVVLGHGEDVWGKTGGAFSPYLGGLTTLWRATRDSGVLPTAEQLHAAGLGETGRLERSSEGVSLQPAGVRIDLGGIGKGFAADEARTAMEAMGTRRTLVALSGDIAVGDAPPGRAGWTIALGGSGGGPGETIEIANACVSTSGDSVQFVEVGGVRYAHVVDPRTGLGCVDPVQATVVAREGWQADALATAMCVRGPEMLGAVNAYPGAAARLVAGAGQARRVWASAGFPAVFAGSAEPAHAGEDDLNARLAWFREARFGMFIHWGLYAIPAGTWNGKEVGGIGEWIMDSARIPPEEYEKLAPRFNPVKFDADVWMQLAKDAGMRYFVITTKHHDGFALFDSAHSAYDIMDATPFKRDIMKELSAAARARGLRVGWYHSIMDWHHPDAKGEAFPKYEQVLRSQVTELLTKYGPIDVMWFDGEWIGEWTPQRGRELYDMCRELAPKAIINNRVGKGRQGMAGLTAGDHPGDFGTPEQEVPTGTVLEQAWESCMTMNDTWGFKSNDHNFKSTTQLVRTLIETVSKGGNFLLNVGPTAEGEIPAASVERLREMGAWMAVNSECIYGKTAAPFKKTPFGRVTFGDGKLYVCLFDLPKEWAAREVLLPGLRAEFASAEFLADPAIKPAFTQRDDGVVIALDRWPHDPHAAVLRMTLADPSKPLRVEETPLKQPAAGAFVLEAADAMVVGHSARYEAEKRAIGFWMDAKDRVVWQVRATRAELCPVTVTLACEPGSAGAEVDVVFPGGTRRFTVPATKGWGDFVAVELEAVEVRPGDFPIEVRPVSKPGQGVMNLRSVTLGPGKPL